MSPPRPSKTFAYSCSPSMNGSRCTSVASAAMLAGPIAPSKCCKTPPNRDAPGPVGSWDTGTAEDTAESVVSLGSFTDAPMSSRSEVLLCCASASARPLPQIDEAQAPRRRPTGPLSTRARTLATSRRSSETSMSNLSTTSWFDWRTRALNSLSSARSSASSSVLRLPMSTCISCDPELALPTLLKNDVLEELAVKRTSPSGSPSAPRTTLRPSQQCVKPPNIVCCPRSRWR
mmetsp:Transcript_33785/g.96120  ORF Transcript_33785/g.96120 Transcript_33785/m.96120 type:complete len:232 (+) Transcript_33785:188-883(+)